MKKKQIKFEIGGLCIAIRTEHQVIKKEIERYYKNFISDREPRILINVEYKNFQPPKFERLIYQNKAWRLGLKGSDLFIYFSMGDTPSLARFNVKLDIIQFYTLDLSSITITYLFPQILFSLMMPKIHALMLHACGISDEKNRGYLFMGPSGEGKSTIAKLAIRQGLTVLNDEQVILRKEGHMFKIYSSPWLGEVNEALNNNFFISKIFFIKKSIVNQIKELDKVDALIACLKNNLYIPINHDIITRRFNICSDLIQMLPGYQLYFRNDDTLWGFLDDFFKGRS